MLGSYNENEIQLGYLELKFLINLGYMRNYLCNLYQLNFNIYFWRFQHKISFVKK